MDDNDLPQMPPGSHEVPETSEATLIVDKSTLSKVRDQQTQQRDQAYVIVIAGPHTGKMFKIDRSATVMGRSPNVDLQIQDVGVSRTHARLSMVGETIFVEDMQSANGTFLNGERVSVAQQLQDGDKITLGSTTILKFTYHDALDEDFQKRMFDAALRDSLTGAFNKKYFLNQLATELSYAVRHRSPLCLTMFDVDHFKYINDTHGHLAGDHILKEIGRLTLESIRSEDAFARYGGEEFAVVSRGLNNAQGQMLADRLRNLIGRHDFMWNGAAIPITVSMGVASFPEIATETSDGLIAAADGALYEAKRNGRNRTEVAR